METEIPFELGTLRNRGPRTSYSQFSLDHPYKELPEQSEPEDEWCKVKQIKTNDKNLSLWENERGYQGEIIYLRLTEMLIEKTEKLHWENLTKDMDFLTDPGPITWETSKFEVAVPADEETVYTEVEDAIEIDYYDEPCSSTSFQKKKVENLEVEVESDGEAIKTDYEDFFDEREDKSTEKVVEELLRNFEKQTKNVEKQEELISMVSLSDASQNYLPRSVDIPIPGDEIYTVDGKRIRLRGTAIWAPPKRKFIFDLPEILNQQAQLTQQHYRCAGCGMKLTKLYARRAKFCNYYNKLFCQCCFVGDKAKIPSRILHQWNFKEYPVCDLAFKFLQEHEDHPVYNVRAVNPDLFKKVKNLKRVRQSRIKASHMWQYISLCKESENTVTKFGNLKTMFTSIPRRYITLEESETYSIMDFINVESGNMVEMLEPLVYCGKIHIEGCSECQQRSFLCQICINPNEFLFSFQLDKVYQCDGCGALSHLKCYNKVRKTQNWQCSRCERIRRKKYRQSRQSVSTECQSD